MDAALFVDPASHHFLEDRLFDLEAARLNGDELHAPYVHLKRTFEACGIPVHTGDRLVRGEVRAARNVYVSLGYRGHLDSLAARPDVVLSGFFAFECPIVEPALYRALPSLARSFRRVFSFSDAASLSRFVKDLPRLHAFRIPYARADVRDEVWRNEDRAFLVMMNANKTPRLRDAELYTERLRAMAHFARRGEIDLYGTGWDAPPWRMGASRVPFTARRAGRRALAAWHRLRPDPLLDAARRAWRGPAPSKAETLGRYRFAICFENMVLRGWITEKLFDCFAAGTVPVYLGAPEIDTIVPRDCFVDMRHFSGYDELGEHLRSLSDAEIRGYRERARAFLRSEAFRPFTKEAFTDLIARLVEEDAGVARPAPIAPPDPAR